MRGSPRSAGRSKFWSLRPARARDEHGAIALIVAAFSLALFVLAGFAVDFGQAYNSKQQLQSGADAASLAALSVYKGDTRPCPALKADSTLLTAATTAANAIAKDNRSGAPDGTLSMSCNASNQLTATYLVGGSTTSFVGRLTGTGDNIVANRSAGATLKDAPFAAGQLRPWGLCSGAITTSGNVVFVPLLNGAVNPAKGPTDPCGDGHPPGGWWVGQCIGQGNGTGASATTVDTGCDSTDAYAPVPGQPTSPTPTQLYNYLNLKCPKKASSVSCLASDSGTNFHTLGSHWAPLVGQTFTMPVFCSTPKCSQLADAGGGNTGSYAIQRIATVVLCGYKLSAASGAFPTTGPCATRNPKGYVSSDVTSGYGLFVVVEALTGGTGDELPWQMPNPVLNLTQ